MRKTFISIVAALALTVTAQAKTANFFDIVGPPADDEVELICKYLSDEDADIGAEITLSGGSYDTGSSLVGQAVTYFRETQHEPRAHGIKPVPKRFDVRITWRTEKAIVPASVKTFESEYSTAPTQYNYDEEAEEYVVFNHRGNKDTAADGTISGYVRVLLLGKRIDNNGMSNRQLMTLKTTFVSAAPGDATAELESFVATYICEQSER